jgi:hypothetical protein
MIKNILIFLLFTACVLSQSSCPNNCNRKGVCENNVCRCNRFFYGEDCSIWRDVLENGVLKEGVVSRFEWRFYNFTLNVGETFSLTVTQKQEDNDIDVYIQRNALPSFIDHIMEEVGTDTEFYLYLDEPVTEKTTFYVGVFGFHGTTDFTLLLNVNSGGCPDGCSGRGTCTRGTCLCNSGFGGDYCEFTVNRITLGQQYDRISVGEDEWMFFSYTLTTVANLQLHLTQSNGDVDIYVRFGGIPTFYDYQYVDQSINEAIDILISAPETGTWYFGFYGYSASTFSFKLSRSTECPDRCSKHGTCQNSVCTCNQGFSGRACETKTSALNKNEVVQGFVNENSWNFYRFQSNSANSFIIQLNQTQANMDCDIYVQRDRNPTLLDFVYNDLTTGNVAHLRVDDAGSATWYIGIFGYSACEYTMQVFDSVSCPGGCGTHGTCNSNGRCICNNGWVGANCETQSGTFVNGNTLIGQRVAPGEWKYYSIVVQRTSQLNVIVKETESTGLLWVFVSAGQYPTLSSHEEDSTDTATSIHRISLEFTTPRSDTQYFVGVYGSPFSLRDTEFSISIYYAPF